MLPPHTHTHIHTHSVVWGYDQQTVQVLERMQENSLSETTLPDGGSSQEKEKNEPQGGSSEGKEVCVPSGHYCTGVSLCQLAVMGAH